MLNFPKKTKIFAFSFFFQETDYREKKLTIRERFPRYAGNYRHNGCTIYNCKTYTFTTFINPNFLNNISMYLSV